MEKGAHQLLRILKTRGVVVHVQHRLEAGHHCLIRRAAVLVEEELPVLVTT